MATTRPNATRLHCASPRDPSARQRATRTGTLAGRRTLHRGGLRVRPGLPGVRVRHAVRGRAVTSRQFLPGEKWHPKGPPMKCEQTLRFGETASESVRLESSVPNRHYGLPIRRLTRDPPGCLDPDSSPPAVPSKAAEVSNPPPTLGGWLPLRADGEPDRSVWSGSTRLARPKGIAGACVRRSPWSEVRRGAVACLMALALSTPAAVALGRHGRSRGWDWRWTHATPNPCPLVLRDDELSLCRALAASGGVRRASDRTTAPAREPPRRHHRHHRRHVRHHRRHLR